MWNMEGQGWLIEAKGLLGPGVQLETLGREKVSNLSYPQEYQWRLILMRWQQHNVPLLVLYSCWLIVFKLCCSDSNEGLGRQNDISASAF